MGQEKIVLQKDILKAGSGFFLLLVRFRPRPPRNNQNPLQLALYFYYPE
jgi:hypothetical protein